ncbi:MAG: glycosyltransferase [Balneolaceae bacterium]|nr:glycosyltransferase [Balneolaceae bacterium]
MDKPSVSVILPVYNAAGTLDEAVESICSQSLQDWELVAVDDGSTDGSAEKLRQWAGRDPRIRPLFREHRGIVPSLNDGVEAARAPLLARMDGDDRSMPRRLELQKKLLDRSPDTGLASCLVRHLGEEEETAGYARHVRWINSLTGHDEIARSRFIESPLAHPSVMFRAGTLRKYGGYRDGDFPEDYELWLRWLEAGVRMQKVEQELLLWRDEPGRLSRTDARYAFEAFYRIKAGYLARWLKRNNPRHPEVVIWGAGRTTRKRAELLCPHGVEITHYVDIDPNKIGNTVHGRPVWSPDDLPNPGRRFVVSYVGRHGANSMIRKDLTTRGYREVDDFIFAA